MLIAFVCYITLVGMILSETWEGLSKIGLGIPTVIFIVFGLVFQFIQTRQMKCPHCNLNPQVLSRRYCPHCGSKDVKAGRFLKSYSKCNECGTKFTRGRYSRHYMIRYCQRCGTFLDKKGF